MNICIAPSLYTPLALFLCIYCCFHECRISEPPTSGKQYSHDLYWLKIKTSGGWLSLLRFAGIICIINMNMFCITDSVVVWASDCLSWVFVMMMTVWNVHCGFCRHFFLSRTKQVRNDNKPTHSKPQRFQYTNTHASLLQLRCQWALLELFLTSLLLTGAKCSFMDN